ncbi:site-2 protease family protein [Spirochaeta cellobiosiphila]|uniref:site-2 protease family protein n=1 Tax=Spirochaeta cellobiosiphila TaxID=504483 RepID=UPI00042833EC|nr:site-2 protease family protein [Spirochaeta cellobiosiphila]
MNFSIERLIYIVPAVIIGFTVHEWAHAIVADKLGDTLARQEGRLTLNPLKQIDPLGMLFVVIAGFGWARPVRFVPGELKNESRDRVLISMAGPFSNLVLALITLSLLRLNYQFLPGKLLLSQSFIFTFLIRFSAVNLGLFLFNLIPLPPLDGSHLVFSSFQFSPELEQKITTYGGIALFILIILESQSGYDILPIGKFVNLVIGLFFSN